LVSNAIPRAVAAGFTEAAGWRKRRAQPVGNHKEVCGNPHTCGGKAAARQCLHNSAPMQRHAHLRRSPRHLFLQMSATHPQRSVTAESRVCAAVGIVEGDAREARSIPLVQRQAEFTQ
jgi:hypothetical protein